MGDQMAKKPKLSKNLMQMKFMQRTISDDQEERVAEIVQHTLKRKSDDVRKQSDKFALRFEPSYAALEDLSFGRMSFQGFNAEVERWMAHHVALRAEKAAKSLNRGMKKDVTDEEAAIRLSSVSKTIGRRFTEKRKRVQEAEESGEVEEEETLTVVKAKKSRHFKRPDDDS